MGNTATSAKGALAIASAKDQLGKTFSGDSKNSKSSVEIENPQKRSEMKKRHKERELE